MIFFACFTYSFFSLVIQRIYSTVWDREKFLIGLYQTLLHVLSFCLPCSSLKILIQIFSISCELPCPWSYLLLFFAFSEVLSLFEMTAPQQSAWGYTTDLWQDTLSSCSASWFFHLLILSLHWKDGVVEFSITKQKTRLGGTWGQRQWSKLLPKAPLVNMSSLFLKTPGDSTAL